MKLLATLVFTFVVVVIVVVVIVVRHFISTHLKQKLSAWCLKVGKGWYRVGGSIFNFYFFSEMFGSGLSLTLKIIPVYGTCFSYQKCISLGRLSTN